MAFKEANKRNLTADKLASRQGNGLNLVHNPITNPLPFNETNPYLAR